MKKKLYKAFSELCDKLDNISCPVMIVCGERDNANKNIFKANKIWHQIDLYANVDGGFVKTKTLVKSILYSQR